MAPTFAPAKARTHQKAVLESLDALKARAVPVLNDSERVKIDQNLSHKPELLALVDEARIRAGMSQKEMAINAGVPEGPFSEALRGVRGNFAIHWLDRQPDVFWLAFHRITADRYGITPQKQDEVWADRIGELVTLLIKSRTVVS